MSSGELLLVLLVTLCVFRPNKFPMLAKDLAKFIHFCRKLAFQVQKSWKDEMNQYQLQINEKAAEQSDNLYEKYSNKD